MITRSSFSALLLAASLPLGLAACSAAPDPAPETSPREEVPGSVTPSPAPESTFHPITPIIPTPIICGPCQSDGLLTCTRAGVVTATDTCSNFCPDVYPQCGLKPLHSSWPELDSFIAQFGCIDAGDWYNSAGGESADPRLSNEAYVLCPASSALTDWMTANPAGLNPGSTWSVAPVHAAAACDACLAAPVSGWTYVFFDNVTAIDPRPGCTGSGCNVTVVSLW